MIGILVGDCRNLPLPDDSIDSIIADPSYFGLQGYGCKDQIGGATCAQDYLDQLMDCFDELHRVLKSSGSCWFISGDLHPAICGIPFMSVLTLQARGWLLHHDFIWSKPQRCHDYIFLLSKDRPFYFQIPEYDSSVWHYEREQAYPGALFEPLPTKLVETCIKSGCPDGGVILNPFSGAGTVGVVAQELGYDCISLDLDPDAARIAKERLG